MYLLCQLLLYLRSFRNRYCSHSRYNNNTLCYNTNYQTWFHAASLKWLLSHIDIICVVDSLTSVVVSGKCDNCQQFFTSELSALKWQSCKRSRVLVVTSVTPCASTKSSASSHIVERPHRYRLWEKEKTCDCHFQKINRAWLKCSLKDEILWCVDAPARHSSQEFSLMVCMHTGFWGNHLNVTLVEMFYKRWCLKACILTLKLQIWCQWFTRLAEYNTVTYSALLSVVPQWYIQWRFQLWRDKCASCEMWRQWFTRLAEYNAVTYSALSVLTQRYMQWWFHLWRDKCASCCAKNQ